MPKHPRLWKRNGVYYFSAKVPRDLIPAFGTEQVRYSLNTKDAATANRVIKEHSLKFDQQCDAKRRNAADQPEPSEADIYKLADAWEAHILEEDEEARLEEGERHHRKLAEALDIIEDKRALAVVDSSNLDDEIEDFVTAHGFALPTDPRLYRKLAYAFLKADARASGKLRQRQEGQAVDTPQAAPPVPAKGPISAPGTGTMQDLFDYWKRQEPRSEKTLANATTALRKFTSLHGDMPASAVQKAHILALRDKMVESGSSPATIKKDLGLLAAMFQVAIDDDHKFSVTVNPRVGVKVKGEVGEARVRVHFGPEDLKRIFASPVYSQGERPLGGAGEAAFWLPLIALFTGARLNEIGQLRPGDVKQEEGIWHVVFTDEGEGMQLKEGAKNRRRVPVHPELTKLGFLDYAEKMKDAGAARLFPEIKPDSRDHLTGRWSKWWNRYLDSVGIKEKGKDFHSFRHTFKHYARACGMPEDAHDAMTGHQNPTIGRNYGNAWGYPLKPLNAAIRRLKYPGLDLNALAMAADEKRKKV